MMDKKVFNKIDKKEVIGAFDIFDYNKDGKINTKEFEFVMRQAVKKNGTLSGDEVKSLIKLADPDETGEFDYK